MDAFVAPISRNIFAFAQALTGRAGTRRARLDHDPWAIVASTPSSSGAGAAEGLPDRLSGTDVGLWRAPAHSCLA